MGYKTGTVILQDSQKCYYTYKAKMLARFHVANACVAFIHVALHFQSLTDYA